MTSALKTPNEEFNSNRKASDALEADKAELQQLEQLEKRLSKKRNANKSG
ncbi:hypothetical protein [Dryocola clanedunensis]